VALSDTLRTSFGEGGFSLEGAVGALESGLGAIAPAGAGLDEGAIGSIGELLSRADLGAIASTVGTAAAQAGVLPAGLADPAALVAPLSEQIALLERIGGGEAAGLATALETAATGTNELGLQGLGTRLAAVADVAASEPVAGVASLAGGLVPGFDVDSLLVLLRERAPALGAVVQLLGAFMAVDELTTELGETSSLIGGLLGTTEATAVTARLEGWRGATPGAAIAGIDPDDAFAVQAAVAPIAEFADAVRTSVDVLVRGMAFGEATLAHVDLPELTGRLDAASAALSESAAAPVRTLALDVRARLEPLLATDLGPPAASLDVFWDEAMGLVDDLATTVDGIDPSGLAAPVTAIVDDALTTVQTVGDAAEAATAAIRSALQTAAQVIASFDLRPVTEALQSALAPIVEALDALDALLGEAEEAVRGTATAVTEAMTTVRDLLGGAAETLGDAFDRVRALVDALELEQLQQTLEGELESVTAALEAAELQPFFDAANDAIETAADVVAKVPIELLPDDVRSELDEVIRPIKAIDFDTDVRAVLVAQLQVIMDSLETDVLDEVEVAYQAVVAFLEEIAPRAPLEQLEQEAFDPMLERVRTVDPAAVLEPATRVLDELRAAVAGLDVRGDVLDPLDAAFDEVAGPLDALDPAPLLAPLEERVTAAREAITGTLGLDTWSERITAAETFATALAGRLDWAALVDLLDAAFDEIRPRPDAGTDVSAVPGTIVSGLLEGTGLTARADAFATVRRWLGGADPAGEVRGRLEAAAASLDGALAVVSSVDPQPLVAAVQPVHRDLVQALAAYPESSLLRRTADPLLAGADPLELLGTAVDNRARYLAALEDAAALLRSEAASGRSELTTAAAALREALRPLTAIPDRLRALFARFGVDPAGKSLGTIAAETLELLRPSRALAPLSAAVEALVAKVLALLHDGVFAPALATVAELEAVLAALDISFVRTTLEAVYAEVVAQVELLRPSALLGDLAASAEETLAAVAAFDPLGAVRDAIDAMKAAIDDVAADFRPTVLYAPLLDAYDALVDAAGGLDVRSLLEPVLAALSEIEAQLEAGLDETAAALTELQGALP
jgi:hypothetical protein